MELDFLTGGDRLATVRPPGGGRCRSRYRNDRGERQEARALGCNMLVPDYDRRLASTDNDRVIGLLSRGYAVDTFALDPFTRRPGGVHWLTMPLDHENG